jgi:lipoprotein signal peptidase
MTLESPGSPRGKVWLRLAVVAFLLGLDLWSKSSIFALLQGGADLVLCDCGLAHHRWHVLGEGTGWFTFLKAENSGAAFGFGAAWPMALVMGRVAAVIVLLVLLMRTTAGRPIMVAAFVLILAGALGNLYDNLGRANWSAIGDPGEVFKLGSVRDFIDVYFARWKWHFPTFNVADSCITVGAVLLLGSGLVGHPEDQDEKIGPSPGPDPEGGGRS